MKDIMFEDFEVAMKVVIVGNGSVGKSSMIQRYCRGIFTRDYKKTIGVDFLERVLNMEDQQIRLMLWDTAGQEEFDAITRTYYRGAHACVIACSLTDRESFLALPKWKSKVAKECGDIPMVLVANKTDLQKQAVIESSELESMAKSLGITSIFRTSVKEDTNVNSVFNHLAKTYLTMMSALDDEPEEIPSDDNDGNLLLKSSYDTKSWSNNHNSSNNTSTFNLFGKKSKKSSSKAGKQGANNNVHQSMNNGNGYTEKPTYHPPPPLTANNNSQNQLNKQNNPVQFKGILRTPVINVPKASNGHSDFSPRHHHGQAVNIFTGGHKNKLIFSSPHVPSNNGHLHNGGSNHISNGRKSLGNGITLERYAYGSSGYGGKGMLAGGGGQHAVPRWTDMSKYDNMPFRLDLSAPPPKKHHKRALCNIL